ncbi:MAG: hypothetical protein ACD_2C00052G0015, partial [uncultured bacterium (gcode 4)]
MRTPDRNLFPQCRTGFSKASSRSLKTPCDIECHTRHS